MGAYVNPKNMTKEQWLNDNALLLDIPPRWEELEEGDVFVCLINNLAFTAAAIAYNEKEFDYFMQPDTRPRTWYIAVIEDLRPVSPELENYLPSTASS